MKTFFKNNILGLLILVVLISTMCMVYKDMKLNSLLFHSVQNVNMEDQHFCAVLGAYDEYLKLNKNDKFAYFMKGKAYYLNGEFEKAIPYIEKCKELGGKFPKIYRYLGNLNAELGNYEAAFNHYSEGLELFPENAILLNNYAYLNFLNKGDVQKSLKYVNKALAIDPFSEAYHTRAEIENSIGLYNEAIKDCDNALKIKPSLYFCNCEKGYSLMKLGKRKEAIKQLQICKKASLADKEYKYTDMLNKFL